jgi:hypothetical protein
MSRRYWFWSSSLWQRESFEAASLFLPLLVCVRPHCATCLGTKFILLTTTHLFCPEAGFSLVLYDWAICSSTVLHTLERSGNSFLHSIEVSECCFMAWTCTVFARHPFQPLRKRLSRAGPRTSRHATSLVNACGLFDNGALSLELCWICASQTRPVRANVLYRDRFHDICFLTSMAVGSGSYRIPSSRHY